MIKMTTIERIAFNIDLWLQAHTFEVMVFSVAVFAGVWCLIIYTWGLEANDE